MTLFFHVLEKTRVFSQSLWKQKSGWQREQNSKEIFLNDSNSVLIKIFLNRCSSFLSFFE